MLSPGQPSGWMELSASSDHPYPAAMSVERALRCVPPHGNLDASDLSQAHARTGNAPDAFRSIMIAPWRREGWEELSYAVSSQAA
ncbi:Tetratricopeptide-like helical [Penicillium waksmanii]|uniref:Tetratricopeptide-like helical n=1 Tax=Penicillium waksmanii TaxID=69791 RepID=UPI002548DA3D|nr:Tetratricopeptide-like helical [Penicillium waksmanii]KAJ5965507.1 Tetratricopeptide-like helical [Penicillium waksmanii]